jgi:hypothetical protein
MRAHQFFKGGSQTWIVRNDERGIDAVRRLQINVGLSVAESVECHIFVHDGTPLPAIVCLANSAAAPVFAMADQGTCLLLIGLVFLGLAR